MQVQFIPHCPHRELLEQLMDKWSALILLALDQQPMRFNGIKRVLNGVTQKALTQSLRKLERNGIVSRTVLATSPVAVEYAITPIGQELKKTFCSFYQWTLQHMPEIEKAQMAYDTIQASQKESSGTVIHRISSANQQYKPSNDYSPNSSISGSVASSS